MTLAEIKAAIEGGHKVKVGNDAYDVVKTIDGQYSIVCNRNQYTIGLTWLDGVTLNAAESDFYIKEA